MRLKVAFFQWGLMASLLGKYGQPPGILGLAPFPELDLRARTSRCSVLDLNTEIATFVTEIEENSNINTHSRGKGILIIHTAERDIGKLGPSPRMTSLISKFES